MKVLQALIKWMSVPLLFLTWVGAPAAGIWLAFLGEWKLIGLGLLAMFFGRYPVSIALIPWIGIAALGSKAWDSMRSVSWVLRVLGNLYLIGVMTVWCIGTLYFVSNAARSGPALPFLIWAFQIAIAPWDDMAVDEARSGDGASAQAMAFFCQTGFFLIILLYLAGASLISLVIVDALVLSVGVAINFADGLALQKAQASRAGVMDVGRP